MRMIQLIASAVLAASLATAVSAAPALDKAGKCRDNGKFVAAAMCKAPAAAPMSAMSAGGKCRDAKTKKFAKCGAAGTEAVPMSAKAK